MILFPNPTHRLVFDGEQLPHLVYMSKHEYSAQRLDRPMHSHDSICELIVCYRGFGTYHVNNQSYSVQAGDLIFGNINEPHELISDFQASIGNYCFGFSHLHLAGLPENHFFDRSAVHVRPTNEKFPLFHQIAEQIHQLYDDTPYNQTLAELLSITLLMMAVQAPAHAVSASGSIENHGQTLTRRVKEYIDAHFTESITLEEIATTLHCSVPYVSHTFKHHTGFSPIQYAIRRRIGLAQTYLISSDLSATQIATMVGYDNTNYFNTLFTRTVGLTPIRYRKEYLQLLRGQRDQS